MEVLHQHTAEQCNFELFIHRHGPSAKNVDLCKLGYLLMVDLLTPNLAHILSHPCSTGGPNLEVIGLHTAEQCNVELFMHCCVGRQIPTE